MTWRMLVPDRRVVWLAVFLGLAVFLLLVHPAPLRLNLRVGPALQSAPAQASSTGEAQGSPATRAPATTGSELMATLAAPTPRPPARGADQPAVAPDPQPAELGTTTPVVPLGPPPVTGPAAQSASQPPAALVPSSVVVQKAAGKGQGCIHASSSATGKACAPPGQEKKGPRPKP